MKYLTVYQYFKDFPDQVFLSNYQSILSYNQDKLINFFLIINKIYKLFIWIFLISEYNYINLKIMAKKIYIQQNHPELSVVNTDTGEIISGVATTKVESIDEFIMVFLLNIQDAFKLEGQHLKILMCCWKYSSFNPSAPEGNRITNNQALKTKIRESGLEVSDTVINNAFTAFVKNDLMIKECRGQYLLNPKYFFRGTLSSRSKLKLQIEN